MPVALYGAAVAGQEKNGLPDTAGVTKTYSCAYSFSLRYPKPAEEKNISGVVIIEVDVDENGLWSNPVVIQHLGYGCDEESLRVMKSIIPQYNRCIAKLKLEKFKKGKMRQPFRFRATDDPDPE